ncbi:family 13 putative glycoside hydrolase [Triangularia verruculosa]|uniref:Family 13 putative glycoside hydrolase n=1 Tax=Triangularia verruculosa TaxID=2587418 RepID=A0AAN6XQA6_9PEZI|nr:family 13 putative glycoside hydrolase [Triangularia verruculosa]
MSKFLSLPDPSLPPQLAALSRAATRQEPGSGYSTNIRPLRRRITPSPGCTAPENPLIIPSTDPCPQNETMIQGFEWYVPSSHSTSYTHWQRLTKAIPQLGSLGITKMWIPPACKAADAKNGNGYDIYDLWDLGEFEQKGSAPTKWGSKAQLELLCKIAEGSGVKIIFDAVLNHKTGADYKEKVKAKKVDPLDRNKELDGGEAKEIESWTGFNFPGRGGRYSNREWNKHHFTGVDWDDITRQKGIWKLEGKEWSNDVDEEVGNYDFLMFADVDHRHPEVQQDIFDWVRWLPTQLKMGGLRLDAIKHYSFRFQKSLLEHIDRNVENGRDWFIVGEYWREDSEFLAKYIEYMDHRIALFDVPLCSNFSRISMAGERGDMRELFNDALCLWKPNNVVTFVVNHDTQQGQSLETPVAPWFLPHAYSLILLRANTGLPCVFYSDLYGSFANGPSSFIPPMSGNPSLLARLILLRKLYAYGTQHDYFWHSDFVGFTREGHPSHSGGAGLAVLMSNRWSWAREKMFVGQQHTGEQWIDVLEQCPGKVTIDEQGWGDFTVPGNRGCSVWINETAEGRWDVTSLQFDSDIYGIQAEMGRRQHQVERRQQEINELSRQTLDSDLPSA